MVVLNVKVRNKVGKTRAIESEQGSICAVFYGPEIKENVNLEVPEKEFEKIYREFGESSLITLDIEGKKFEVLIHQVSRDALSGRLRHIDFYSPSTKKEVEVEIPLIFEGESLAVKDLSGVLVKEIQELKVKGLAHNLPREIRVDISGLRTFEDRVRVKDLVLPGGITSLRHADEIIVLAIPQREEKETVVSAPTNIDESKEPDKNQDQRKSG